MAESPRAELLGRIIAWYAEHGVGDTSMRTLAAEVGTSNRMIHYHFGSREDLLAAVVEEVERSERAALEELVATVADPWEAGLLFWDHVADRAQRFAPLYFELAGQAMQGHQHAASLRAWLGSGWSEAIGSLFVRAGWPADEAAVAARLSLAVSRGLLFELALTGDRAAADAAVAAYAARLRAGR